MIHECFWVAAPHFILPCLWVLQIGCHGPKTHEAQGLHSWLWMQYTESQQSQDAAYVGGASIVEFQKLWFGNVLPALSYMLAEMF